MASTFGLLSQFEVWGSVNMRVANLALSQDRPKTKPWGVGRADVHYMINSLLTRELGVQDIHIR